MIRDTFGRPVCFGLHNGGRCNTPVHPGYSRCYRCDRVYTDEQIRAALDHPQNESFRRKDDEPAEGLRDEPPGEYSPVSLRDYFAAQALNGYIAAHSGEMAIPDHHRAARAAYGYADAMLAERERPKERQVPDDQT